MNAYSLILCFFPFPLWGIPKQKAMGDRLDKVFLFAQITRSLSQLPLPCGEGDTGALLDGLRSPHQWGRLEWTTVQFGSVWFGLV
jgi:hypothetical protein